MPIQFTCPHCGQVLSVTRRKVGQPVQCVRCGGGVIVPPPPMDSSLLDDAASVPDVDAAESVYSEMDELIASPMAQVGPGFPDGAVDGRHGVVQVTRSTLYAMGGLLVAVAIASFVLGWAMGRDAMFAGQAISPNTKHRIYGRLTFDTDRGETWPDSEAVVIALPSNHRPDEKIEIAGLRPDVPPPDGQHLAVQAIRSIGGDFQRTNRTGDFELVVPSAGDYFVLMISSHLPRSADQPPTTKEIVELGNYFKQADALLGRNDFHWSKQLLRTDLKSDYLFRNE